MQDGSRNATPPEHKTTTYCDSISQLPDRSGLICFQVYVPWNFHEAVPGVFDFADQRAVGNFIAQAAQLDLHVLLRPGPYICAEWEMGGLPAWLLDRRAVGVIRPCPILSSAALRHAHSWTLLPLQCGDVAPF